MSVIKRSWLVESHRMALSFLGDRKLALCVPLRAGRRLPYELENQYKRSVLNAKKRTVTNLESKNLFLALSLDEIDELARKQEDIFNVSTRERVRRFALHLLRAGRQHSFHVAIAVCRILHRYSKEETERLYETILSGPPSERYREIKRQLMASAKERFSTLRSILSAGNEQRFLPCQPDRELINALQTAMRECNVWGGVAPTGDGPDFTNWLRSLLPISISESTLADIEAVHRKDRARMAAVTDPDAFALLISCCGFDDPISCADIPAFLPPDPTIPNLDIVVSEEALQPTSEDVDFLESALAEEDRLCNQWLSGDISIELNGEPQCSLTLGELLWLSVDPNRGVHVVDIWGSVEGQRVLLGHQTLNVIGHEALERVIELPEARLRLGFRRKEQADSSSAQILVSYDPAFVFMFTDSVQDSEPAVVHRQEPMDSSEYLRHALDEVEGLRHAPFHWRALRRTEAPGNIEFFGKHGNRSIQKDLSYLSASYQVISFDYVSGCEKPFQRTSEVVNLFDAAIMLEDIDGLLIALAEEDRLCNQWLSGDISIELNGEPQCSLTLGELLWLSVDPNRGVHVVDIWGSVEGQRVLLGHQTLNVIGHEALERVIELPEARLRLGFRRKEQADSSSAQILVSYDPAFVDTRMKWVFMFTDGLEDTESAVVHIEELMVSREYLSLTLNEFDVPPRLIVSEYLPQVDLSIHVAKNVQEHSGNFVEKLSGSFITIGCEVNPLMPSSARIIVQPPKSFATVLDDRRVGIVASRFPRRDRISYSSGTPEITLGTGVRETCIKIEIVAQTPPSPRIATAFPRTFLPLSVGSSQQRSFRSNKQCYAERLKPCAVRFHSIENRIGHVDCGCHSDLFSVRDVTRSPITQSASTPPFLLGSSKSPVWAQTTGTLEIEALTNQWYSQDVKVRINTGGTWTFSPVHLAGKGRYNNHTLRATIVKDGRGGRSATVSGIVVREQ